MYTNNQLVHKRVMVSLILCSLLLMPVIITAESEEINPRITKSSLSNKERAVSYYNTLEPQLYVNNVEIIASETSQYYEIASSYEINTKKGPLSVELVSLVDQTGSINIQQKQINFQDTLYEEQEDELIVLYDSELVRLSNIENKNAKQKCIINGVTPLVRRERFQHTLSDSQKHYALFIDASADIPHHKKVVETEKYACIVVERSNLNDLLNSNDVIKICELDNAYVVEFVEYAKEIFQKESLDRIRELKLKRTHLDVSPLLDLDEYLNEDEWNVQPGDSSPYQQFVTPQDITIQQLASGLTDQEIFDLAVDWIWVSDGFLHGKVEKWLLPREFLSATPGYVTNPSPGTPVSDCSEQANTLVSLLRASGVAAEDVRVALGEVNFDGEVGGHAWVEIKYQGKWLVLDPTCGPYYDEQEIGEVLSRSGLPFEYWKYHPYPVEEVWMYYNDVYYTDENEEVADGWSTEYDIFTDADMFAGLIPAESISFFLLYFVLSVGAIVLLGSVLWYRRSKER